MTTIRRRDCKGARTHCPRMHAGDGARRARGLRTERSSALAQNGSVLVIMLWISFALVAITICFADAMSSELRASANRAAGLAADQAIEGAARYVGAILSTFATNGVAPDLTMYQAEAIPVGDAHFWIIGRDPSGTVSSEPYFSLIDEGAKINLNHANTNELEALPNITPEFAQAILDWRNPSGSLGSAINYAALSYAAKNASFETVDELRLVYGATVDLLAGADINRNGILDANENDINHNGVIAPGLFEYLTAFSREPNLRSDGTALVNVNTRAQLSPVLQTAFGSTRAEQILSRVTRRSGRPSIVFNNLLQFYLQSGMTSAEFSKIFNALTASSASTINGRVNVNTAGAVVLSCLPGMDTGTAQQLVTYRQQNPDKLTSIAWVADALGSSSAAVESLAQGDYITTRSYQFTADIAALGPYGRGYRRTRFIFDLNSGNARIVYRQDLSRLGWALGNAVRSTWLEKEKR